MSNGTAGDADAAIMTHNQMMVAGSTAPRTEPMDAASTAYATNQRQSRQQQQHHFMTPMNITPIENDEKGKKINFIDS